MGILALKFKNRDRPLEIQKTKEHALPKRMELQSDFDPVVELRIDNNDLEMENLKQPKLMAQFSRIFGKVYFEMRNLEMDMSVRRDEIEIEISQNPKRWGLKEGERITDALINRIAYRDPQYVAMARRFVKARANVKEWEGMLDACKQRSTAIGRAMKEKELEYSPD